MLLMTPPECIESIEWHAGKWFTGATPRRNSDSGLRKIDPLKAFFISIRT